MVPLFVLSFLLTVTMWMTRTPKEREVPLKSVDREASVELPTRS